MKSAQEQKVFGYNTHAATIYYGALFINMCVCVEEADIPVGSEGERTGQVDFWKRRKQWRYMCTECHGVFAFWLQHYASTHLVFGLEQGD